jgi:hypothetical protein
LLATLQAQMMQQLPSVVVVETEVTARANTQENKTPLVLAA